MPPSPNRNVDNDHNNAHITSEALSTTSQMKKIFFRCTIKGAYVGASLGGFAGGVLEGVKIGSKPLTLTKRICGLSPAEVLLNKQNAQDLASATLATGLRGMIIGGAVGATIGSISALVVGGNKLMSSSKKKSIFKITVLIGLILLGKKAYSSVGHYDHTYNFSSNNHKLR